MPAFAVEFVTGEGPRRGQFTLDSERPLGPQVRQMLEELRQHGSVLAGGPGDQLVVLWNGRELELDATLAAQSVSAQRPLELRMRPVPVPVVDVPPPPPPVVRRSRFTRGAYAGILTGMASGLMGWAASAWIRDLGGILSDYNRLDLLTAGLLGACVGAFVLGGDALRRQERPLPSICLGLLLGVLGGGGGAALGLAAVNGITDGAARFHAGRVAAWTILGIVLALAVALRGWRRGARPLVEAGGWGMMGGTVAGIVFSLPGPGDFWQAFAFALVGAAAGGGIGWPAVRRASALIEIETVSGREPGLLRHREWPLADGHRIRVRGAGPGRTDALVAVVEGRCWAGPAGQGMPVVVGGRPRTEPVELRDGDRIDLGASRYRFRRLRTAA